MEQVRWWRRNSFPTAYLQNQMFVYCLVKTHLVILYFPFLKVNRTVGINAQLEFYALCVLLWNVCRECSASTSCLFVCWNSHFVLCPQSIHTVKLAVVGCDVGSSEEVSQERNRSNPLGPSEQLRRMGVRDHSKEPTLLLRLAMCVQ